MDSKAVKEAVMKQVANEANVANARVLIEVRPFYDWQGGRRASKHMLMTVTETAGELLREVRP
jgi:hypothetical protein